MNWLHTVIILTAAFLPCTPEAINGLRHLLGVQGIAAQPGRLRQLKPVSIRWH
jgi:hypothetical protein